MPLLQLFSSLEEGAATRSEDAQILVIGATNRPADLDEAVRRRFQNKILIPLPDAQAHLQILQATFRREKTSLTYEDYKLLADVLEGDADGYQCDVSRGAPGGNTCISYGNTSLDIKKLPNRVYGMPYT
ncbi:hypothetical protein FOCC_FOCC011198 [Frankliniella occidentalis]|nr:hypothetical protein FOCC_FOCC011198 [Frankliniella occidentalis]